MIHGMTKAEIKNKFDEIVDFSGVEKFIDTPVKRYSSGMMIRLGFAVAAHLEPEILIVDEVLAVGDAEFRRKCLEKMQDVSEGGRTVLFVSHNMQAIRQLCHCGIVLEAGKIVHRGPTDEIVDKYLASSSTDQNVNEDLLPQMHLYDNPDLEIYRFEMLDTDGQVIIAPKMKQDFCLKIYCKFNKSDAYNISIAFRDADGLVIGWIVAADEKYRLSGCKGDSCVLTVKVNNIFLAGTYSFLILVKDEYGNKVDYIRFVFFEVLAASLGAVQHPNTGVVQIDSQWSDPVIE